MATKRKKETQPPAMQGEEIDIVPLGYRAFFRRTGIMIRALTVKDILHEQIARKLA
jgi:hypothetical protein